MHHNFNVLQTVPWGRVLLNRFDTHLGRCLREYGEFSQEEIDFLSQFLPPGCTVIDVGANIGALTVPLAQHVGPEGRVLAIEPQRLTYQLLNANVALNSLENVVTRLAACGARGGKVPVPRIMPDITNSPGGLSLLDAVHPDVETEMVEMLPLDLLAVGSVPDLRLIKIDVEGMERQVLLGAKELIKSLQPIIYLEADRDPLVAPLIDTIEAIGYRAWWHFPRLVSAKTAEQWCRDPAHTDRPIDLHNLVSFNLLCLPVAREAEITLEPARRDDTAMKAQERLIAKTKLGTLGRPVDVDA